MQIKRVLRLALFTLGLLAIPMLAMQFTAEVNWSLFDFIVMGSLIFGAGLAYQFLASKIHAVGYRLAVGIGIGAVLLLIWIELAVGIFGTPFAGS